MRRRRRGGMHGAANLLMMIAPVATTPVGRQLGVDEESGLSIGHTLMIVAFTTGVLACLVYACCLFFTVDVCCAPRRQSVGIASAGSFCGGPSSAPSARSYRRSLSGYTVGDDNDIGMVQAVPRLDDEDSDEDRN